MGEGELVLDDRKYTKDHEWVKEVGKNRYQVGITDYAQFHLKTIGGVELPKIGEEVKQSESWGFITSNKACEDLYSPISGKVVATNQDSFGEIWDVTEPNPTTAGYIGAFTNINKNPYETWLLEVETEDKSQLEKLLSPDEYKEEIKKK